MSFAVFADGSANLPQSMLDGIQLLPCDYTIDGVAQTYWGDVDHFDGPSFYEGLRKGKVVKTSLLNTQLFLSRFAPLLTQGQDIIYISMSSGISGTCNAARIAAQELMELYTGRFVHIVDSLGCGFGNGLLAVRAAALSRQGVPVREAAAILKGDMAAGLRIIDDLDRKGKDLRRLAVELMEHFRNLLVRQQLGADAAQLLENLNDVSARLAKGSGTLGKLMTDQELYNEVNALIKDVRQIVDNYRDTTPVSTFGSLIMGGL